jgi:hypothetical protein
MLEMRLNLSTRYSDIDGDVRIRIFGIFVCEIKSVAIDDKIGIRCRVAAGSPGNRSRRDYGLNIKYGKPISVARVKERP